MHQYTTNSLEFNKLRIAQDFLRAIDKAYSYGLIEEGQTMERKLQDCQNRNIELEKDNKKLSEAYQELQVGFDKYENAYSQ